MNSYILDEYEEFSRIMNKFELRKEISNLRNQLATLEERCKEREDKLANIVDKFIPFLEVMSEANQQDLLNSLKAD